MNEPGIYKGRITDITTDSTPGGKGFFLVMFELDDGESFSQRWYLTEKAAPRTMNNLRDCGVTINFDEPMTFNGMGQDLEIDVTINEYNGYTSNQVSRVSLGELGAGGSLDKGTIAALMGLAKERGMVSDKREKDTDVPF